MRRRRVNVERLTRLKAIKEQWRTRMEAKTESRPSPSTLTYSALVVQYTQARSKARRYAGFLT